MSLYVLDTDMLSLFEKQHPVVCLRLSQHVNDETTITVITVEEQLTGWYSLVRRAKHPSQIVHAYDRLGESAPLLARFRILPYTLVAPTRFDNLKRQKLRVAGKDLRIAAIVLENSAIIVSRNRQEFQRVPGLIFEDWSV